MVPNNRNEQVPGGVYGVDPPTGGYINRANKTGEWNTLVIEFRPPSLDPSDRKVIRRAARIKTVLNGHVVFDGAIADSDGRSLNGMGVLGPIRDSAAVTSIWRATPPESFSLSRSPGSTQNRLLICLVRRKRAAIPDLLSRFHREERSGG